MGGFPKWLKSGPKSPWFSNPRATKPLIRRACAALENRSVAGSIPAPGTTVATPLSAAS
jgi:hypothetical protein